MAAPSPNPFARKQLLVCNDGTIESLNAVAYGACLVKPEDELIILTLYYDRPEEHQHAYDTKEYKELVASLHAQAVTKMQKATAMLNMLPVHVRYTTVIRGCNDIGKEILQFAISQGCCGIIVGSHDMNRVKRVLLGSVSHFLLHHATVPVTVVRHEPQYAAWTTKQ